MIKFFSTLLLSAFSFVPLMSQWNIYSIVHNDKEIAHGFAKYIEWSLTYYGKSGTSLMNENMTFNKDNQIVHSEMSNSENIKIDIVNNYDPKTKLQISEISETIHPLMGKTVKKNIFKYDKNNFLTEVISTDGNNQAYEVAKIQNNELGYPILLIIYDKNNKILGGVEKAQYLLDKNRYISSVFSKEGQLKSIDTVILNFSENNKYADPEREYNSNGDIIKSNNSPTEYELHTYEYDHLGNWIKNEVYDVTIAYDGSEVKKLIRLYTRKIIYWKKLNKRQHGQ
jgi:hypothetical protein